MRNADIRAATLSEDYTLSIAAEDLVLRNDKVYNFQIVPYEEPTRNLQKTATATLSKQFGKVSENLKPESDDYEKLKLIASLTDFDTTWLADLRTDYVKLKNYYDTLDLSTGNIAGPPSLEVLKREWFHTGENPFQNPLKVNIPLQPCMDSDGDFRIREWKNDTFPIRTFPCDERNARMMIQARSIERAVVNHFYEEAYKEYQDYLIKVTCADCQLELPLQELQVLSDTYERIAGEFQDCKCNEGIAIDPCSPYFDQAFILANQQYPEVFTYGIDNKLPKINSKLIEWMFITLWLHDGDPKLNPFPFTDEGNVPVQDYADVKAERFNAYVDSLLVDMELNEALSDSRVDLALFDTLQMLKGRGQEIYKARVKEINKERKEENKEKQRKYLAGNTIVLHEVNFAVVDRRGVDPPIADWQPVGASKKIRRLEEPFPDVVIGDRPAFLLARNIPQEQEVTVSPKKVGDIKDSNSGAVKGIASVVRLIVGLAEPVSGLTGLLAATGSPRSGIFRRVIQAPNTEPTGAHSLRFSNNKEEQIDKDFNCDGFLEQVQQLPFSALLSYLIAKDDSLLLGEANARRKALWLEQFGAEMNGNTSNHGFRPCTNLSDIAKSLFQYHVASTLCSLRLQVDFDKLSNYEKLMLAVEASYNFHREIEALSGTFTNQYSKVKQLARQWGTPEHWVLPPSPSSLKPSAANPAPAVSPLYRTNIFTLPTFDSASEYNTNAFLSTDNGKKLDSLKLGYKSASGTVVTVSAGFTQTFDKKNGLERYDVTEADGTLTTEVDDAHFRPFAALHVHPFRIISWQDRFLLFSRLPVRDVLSRFSLVVGTSFPKPLYNIHAGIGVDLFPGVKVVAGQHWFRSTKYEIINNTITDRSSRYLRAGSFIGVSLDPIALVSFTGLFSD